MSRLLPAMVAALIPAAAIAQRVGAFELAVRGGGAVRVDRTAVDEVCDDDDDQLSSDLTGIRGELGYRFWL